MLLFVKTLTGKVITVDVEDNVTIFDMKRAIFDKLGIPVDSQRLISCGNVCEDSKTVGEYEFYKHGLIHLVQKNFRPEAQFSTHKFYVTVHNFYNEDLRNPLILNSAQDIVPNTVFIQ